MLLVFKICTCEILKREAGNCGTAGVPTGLIFGGVQSKKDQWPWLVALYSIDSDKYFCGGTLLSSQLISTVCEFILTSFHFNENIKF